MNLRIPPEAKEQKPSAKKGQITFFFAKALHPYDEIKNGPKMGRLRLRPIFTTQLDRAATFIVFLFIRARCRLPLLTSIGFQPVAA